MTVRISSRRPVRAKIVDEPLPGSPYTVDRADLAAALGREDAGVRIATSRHGVELTASDLGPLAGRCDREGVTLAFGSPERGLPEILDRKVETLPDRSVRDVVDGTGGNASHERDEPERFDLWLNTVPNQGSEVVRTEEAVFATLACLSLTE